MLVMTRKASEAVVLNDAYTVTPREISEHRIILEIEGPEPFHLSGNGQSEITPTAGPATRFECALTMNGMAWIEEDFFIVFIVARSVGGGGECTARLGFEGPRGTELLYQFADGREPHRRVLG